MVGTSLDSLLSWLFPHRRDVTWPGNWKRLYEKEISKEYHILNLTHAQEFASSFVNYTSNINQCSLASLDLSNIQENTIRSLRTANLEKDLIVQETQKTYRGSPEIELYLNNKIPRRVDLLQKFVKTQTPAELRVVWNPYLCVPTRGLVYGIYPAEYKESMAAGSKTNFLIPAFVPGSVPRFKAEFIEFVFSQEPIKDITSLEKILPAQVLTDLTITSCDGSFTAQKRGKRNMHKGKFIEIGTIPNQGRELIVYGHNLNNSTLSPLEASTQN